MAKTAEPHPEAARDTSSRPPRRSRPPAARRCRSWATSATPTPSRPPPPRPPSASAASTWSSTTPARSTSPPCATCPVKRFDLMQQINARGTFVVTQACLPHLRESDHAHVLTLSPPLSVDPRWLRRPQRLHALEDGHDDDHARRGRRRGGGRHRAPTASGRARSSPPPRCRTCSAATRRWPARARPRSCADAALRDPRPRPARTAPATRSSTTRCWPRPGITDLSGYSAEGADLVLDIFVDGWPEGVARLTVVLLSGGTGGAKLARGLLDESRRPGRRRQHRPTTPRSTACTCRPTPTWSPTGWPTRSTSAATACAATPGR